MKSMVLLVWLVVAGERDRLILNQHLDGLQICERIAQERLLAHQARGQQARFLCHEVMPEVGGVNENGNPL